VIVRLYESQRQRGTGRLQFAFPVQAAWRTNLLEENQEKLLVEDRSVIIPYKPYKIITLRIVNGN